MKEKLKGGTFNLKGRMMGDLLVTGRAHYRKPVKWTCKCMVKKDDGTHCQQVIEVLHSRLIHKNNPKTHCGCKTYKEPSLQAKYKKEYMAWHNCIARCHNEAHHGYCRYGAKGVKVCDEWRASFEQFFKDMGPCPEGMSLDRINPHGNYEKSNCRWATDLEQARNKKNTKWVKHPKTGEPVRAADLADELGMTYQALRNKMLDEGTW